jgi:hypothetical protein
MWEACRSISIVVTMPIGTYVRYASNGPPESLTNLNKIRQKARKAGKPRTISEGLEKACRETQTTIAFDWHQSGRQSIQSGKRQGMVETDFNIPRLKVKTLTMNGGQAMVDWRLR